jgi:N utilization substance protein A
MVRNLKKLIEQVAKDKNLPEWLVEKGLKNSIVLAIKKDRKLKNNLEVELTEDGIKVLSGQKGRKVSLGYSSRGVRPHRSLCRKGRVFKGA